MCCPELKHILDNPSQSLNFGKLESAINRKTNQKNR